MQGGKNFIDLSGRTFGRLTALYRVDGPGAVRWACQCSCGNTKTVLSASLRNGLTKSCGCLRKELMAASHTKHNGCGEALYGVLNMMHQRCENPKNKDFRYYGGRGISVCPAWKEYAVFRDWAKKNGYAPGLTIDRINPDGDYCPENCHWITIEEQQKNRRPQSRQKD